MRYNVVGAKIPESIKRPGRCGKEPVRLLKSMLVDSVIVTYFLGEVPLYAQPSSHKYGKNMVR